jgi:hypothetical protein
VQRPDPSGPNITARSGSATSAFSVLPLTRAHIARLRSVRSVRAPAMRADARCRRARAHVRLDVAAPGGVD